MSKGNDLKPIHKSQMGVQATYCEFRWYLDDGKLKSLAMLKAPRFVELMMAEIKEEKLVLD